MFASENSSEGAVKSKLRSVVTSIFGEKWSLKLLGEEPTDAPNISLPKIPVNFKKNTDVQSYSKLIKGPTEFDRLPDHKKRQFNFKFIEELFLVTRKISPKDEDIVNWLNALEQGGSREGIYQALVLDEVYSSLENMNDRPSQKLIDFCLIFSEKFLNQTFQKKSLEDLNFYMIKRLFTEKGLDVLDYFETKDLDSIYRWYAFFSHELALKYPDDMNSPIRREPSLDFHYNWALNTPIQHIKSEFIIKLHTIMNELQKLN